VRFSQFEVGVGFSGFITAESKSMANIFYGKHRFAVRVLASRRREEAVAQSLTDFADIGFNMFVFT
jgi:hypothetical protein